MLNPSENLLGFVEQHHDTSVSRSFGATVCKEPAGHNEDAVLDLPGQHGIHAYPKEPDSKFKLIVTSPPYNLGKFQEDKLTLDEYLSSDRRVRKAGGFSRINLLAGRQLRL